MIKNKRGEGYIQICVMVLVICILLSVFVTFAVSVGVVRLTRSNTKTVLKSFVTQNSIENYGAIKEGHADTETYGMDPEEFISDFAEFCSLDKSGNMYYHKDTNGRTDYYITEPTVEFVERWSLRVHVSYTLYVPIYFDNVQLTTAAIPVTVKTYLSEKF